MEEKKKEVITTEMAHETKEGNKQKTSSLEDTEVSTSMSANVRSADAESRRSSMSLDDNEECKRSKRRTDKEEYSRSRKEDVLATKEDHRNAKKDEHLPKKEDHTHKKDEYQHNKEEHPGTLRCKRNESLDLTLVITAGTLKVFGAQRKQGFRAFFQHWLYGNWNILSANNFEENPEKV